MPTLTDVRAPNALLPRHLVRPGMEVVLDLLVLLAQLLTCSIGMPQSVAEVHYVDSVHGVTTLT